MKEQQALQLEDPKVQDQVKNYLTQVEADLEATKIENAQLSNAQVSLFNNENEENLIKWQLDFREDLDRIYHLLKGHQLKFSEEKGYHYVEPNDPDLISFNEFGVQKIMNIISFYLNRNTILSNYTEAMINWKVYDFGIEFADLIHNMYEDMMDTLPQDDDTITEERRQEHIANKLKFYPMIHKEIVDTIHSAFLRAYHGGERNSLRTARTVHQNEGFNSNPQLNRNHGVPQKTSKWYNPMSWR